MTQEGCFSGSCARSAHKKFLAGQTILELAKSENWISAAVNTNAASSMSGVWEAGSCDASGGAATAVSINNEMEQIRFS
jgi:hypothetical protein